jgi:hypothetical protein
VARAGGGAQARRLQALQPLHLRLRCGRLLPLLLQQQLLLLLQQHQLLLLRCYLLRGGSGRG